MPINDTVKSLNERSDEMRQALTVAEAVKKTTLSRATLYRLMREGQLEYAQVGSRRILFEDALTDLLTPTRGQADGAA